MARKATREGAPRAFWEFLAQSWRILQLGDYKHQKDLSRETYTSHWDVELACETFRPSNVTLSPGVSSKP
eukprot:1341961-Pyramimonas_sp.AAC.1